MGKRHLSKWHLSSRLAFVCPYPSHSLFQWHFKAHPICWWHVLPVKQVLKSLGRKLTWQTWTEHLFPPKSHGSGWSCFNLYINLKKVYGFICVGEHSLLYCAIHSLQRKETVSVGKVGALKTFLLLFSFPFQKVLLPLLDEVNCARRIKLWFVFISCMLSFLLLIPLFNCSLCWMCEAVKHSNSGYCLCWTM